MIHLDTNVVIGLLNGRPAWARARFEALRRDASGVGLSMIAYHELLYGAAASERRLDNERKVSIFLATAEVTPIPFEDADAREAADIRAHLKRAATPIGPFDVLIAAQARARGAPLVTANARDFARVPGLLVVDWTE